VTRQAQVLAAGAVLWREDPADQAEVAVVHRSRYDDWSLPKGKASAKEHLVLTAVREVAEETGFAGRLGPPLDVHRYRVPFRHGTARKVVQFWSMQAGGGSFTPNDEVDELRWLQLDEAGSLVTHDSDRRTLATFTARPRHTVPVALVRHGSAGSRSRWHKPDEQRPLDRRGRRQAEGLVPVLAAYGAEAVLSSQFRRCVQTVQPYARSRRIELEVEPRLSESGFAADPEATTAFVHDVLVKATRPIALCSQGRVMPHVLERLLGQLQDKPDKVTPVPKGGMWVLHMAEGRLVALEQHAPTEKA
jgi:8-oxo-dGTP pyrophosphatase MutT (NUDIX family)/phosphohistidine phosphatase SixA